MHGNMFPGVPGLGLAPAMSTPRINVREQDALRRDAWDRDEAAFARACPQPQTVEKVIEKAPSPVRATAI